MAPGKLYIGRKIRDIRQVAKLTQADFAERLGISTSYLNQIENNQRPVSASVLLLLAEKFGIDFSSLSTNDNDRLVSMLAEALADPVFAVHSPSFQELKLVVQNAPSFAQALLTCHQAYRRNSEQLASLDDHLGSWATEPTAYEEVRDFFHFVDNYVHDLDVAAERLAEDIDIPDSDAHVALAGYLETRHGIRIRRTEPGDDALRRFDPSSRTLHLNPYLPTATRSFQMASQIAAIEREEQIEKIAKRAEFRTADAFEVCKAGLRNYFAGAAILPYRPFLVTAKELRHDIELLASRFGASLEQVAHRLSRFTPVRKLRRCPGLRRCTWLQRRSGHRYGAVRGSPSPQLSRQLRPPGGPARCQTRSG
jgi:XRE family transcriptional regulator, fatty acid utilization regulator